LTKLPVIVVKEEYGLFLKAGVPDLLFRPFKHRVIRYIEVNNLSTRELHDDEYVENTKSDRVLHKKVARPHGLGLILQKGSP
jgi:hypothetical protein